MMVPTLLIVCMFFALSLDAGFWYFDHRWAQNQAEAAAAAGVVSLPDTNTAGAQAAVDSWLQRNGTVAAEDGECPHPATGNRRLITDADGDGAFDTVRVCVRRARPTFFSQLSGITSVYVSAGATATVVMEALPYALMAMHESDCESFTLNSGANISITGGGTYTRSTCTNTPPPCSGPHGALYLDSNATLDTAMNHVVGDWETNCSNAQATPPPLHVDWLPDPLAHLSPPPPPGGGGCVSQPSKYDSSTPITLSEGVYCQRAVFDSNQVATLNPGIYIFEGGLEVNGNAQVTVTGATLFYVTCPAYPAVNPCGTPGNDKPAVHVASNARLSMDGHPAYANVAIWVDRSAVDSNPLCKDATAKRGTVTFDSGASNVIAGRGIIYAINSSLVVNSDSTATMSAIADKICFDSNADLGLPFLQQFAPAISFYAITE